MKEGALDVNTWMLIAMKPLIDIATNLRDMKMGQTWESNEGLFFVSNKEIMRGNIFGREFLGFWSIMRGYFSCHGDSCHTVVLNPTKVLFSV